METYKEVLGLIYLEGPKEVAAKNSCLKRMIFGN